ncbi:twin-arginine translocation signal domain-containing protein [Streptomyces sp. NPDC013178]|uniref:twin-arginine translocation signal domain-containing protein n=1 Tax=Streptomyces sp. NPDC013178 TaxID=3155118 RepID=UPI0033CB73B8
MPSSLNRRQFLSAATCAAAAAITGAGLEAGVAQREPIRRAAPEARGTAGPRAATSLSPRHIKATRNHVVR